MKKIKQREILTNLDDFNNKVINKISSVFNDVEWLNNDGYMNIDKIFFMLDLYYGDRYINFDNQEIFLKKLIFKLSDLLPDIYYKQQLFLQDKLAEFLRDYKNRCIKYVDDGSTQKDSKNRNNMGMSSASVNRIITDPLELQDIPLTQASLNSMEFLENYNSKNERSNINFLSNLKNLWNSDFTLHVEEWLRHLTGLYYNLVDVYNCEDEEEKEYYIFRNNYAVPDVDYLCVENKDKLDQQLALINNNRDDINIIYSKLNDIKPIDTSNFAKLNENNIFTKFNTFARGITLDGYNYGAQSYITFDDDNTVTLQNDNYYLSLSFVPEQEWLIDNSIPVWKNVLNVIEPINNNVETINGEIETLNNDIEELGNQVNENTNQLQTLENELTTQIERINVDQTTQNNNISTNTTNINHCVKKNSENLITTNTMFVKSNNGTLSLLSMSLQAQKVISYDYIQEQGTFRNYVTHKITMKHQTKPIEDLFYLQFRNTGQGAYIFVENNKLSFVNNTVIDGVKSPTTNYQAANKVYVDDNVRTLNNQITTLNDNINLLTNKINNKILELNLSSRDYFSIVDKLNSGTNRMKIYQIDTTSLNININNVISVEYLTSDDKWINFTHKWSSETNLLLQFLRFGSQTDFNPTGTLKIKYLGE